MRVIFDTNVFIAAALKGGFAEDMLRIASGTDVVILVSSFDILKELQEKLVSKFQWTTAEAHFFVTTIKDICEIVTITERLDIITDDPSDNRILECAVAGRADLIVSSDQDVLRLKTFRGIGIVHPKTLSWIFPEYFKKHKR